MKTKTETKSHPPDYHAATLKFSFDEFSRLHGLEIRTLNQIKKLESFLDKIETQKESFYQKYRRELLECLKPIKNV